MPDPVVLNPANFVPSTRTPWGGRYLAEGLKHQLLKDAKLTIPKIVGEAWEVSLGPEFPSSALDDELLKQKIERDPTAWLGSDLERHATQLLVKLIDAREALSLQIHPPEGDPTLTNDESGKPESWYVVRCEKGAGLYLGFKPDVDAKHVRSAIEEGSDVSSLLNFVPVAPGDFFVIEPCTPHAIGAGIVLVEPQTAQRNKRGVTYRYWDWNRRYDAAGKQTPEGSARELHLDRALSVTDWQLSKNENWLENIRLRCGSAEVSSRPTLKRLCGRTGPLYSEHLEVHRISGQGQSAFSTQDRMWALSVLEGSVEIISSQSTTLAIKGQSMVLPATLGTYQLKLESAHAIAAACA